MYKNNGLSRQLGSWIKFIFILASISLTNCAGSKKYFAANNHDYTKTTEHVTPINNSKNFSITPTQRYAIPKISAKSNLAIIKDFSPPNYAVEE